MELYRWALYRWAPFPLGRFTRSVYTTVTYRYKAFAFLCESRKKGVGERIARGGSPFRILGEGVFQKGHLS